MTIFLLLINKDSACHLAERSLGEQLSASLERGCKLIPPPTQLRVDFRTSKTLTDTLGLPGATSPRDPHEAPRSQQSTACGHWQDLGQDGLSTARLSLFSIPNTKESETGGNQK